MRFLPLLLFLPLIFNSADAQQFSNDWIVRSQPYLKATVEKEGVYQVSGSQLAAAGWALPIAATRVQVWHLGQEIAIEVQDGGDGQLDAGDMLRFYGLKNSGGSDSLLYRPHAARANPYYSLYSDETAYFITVAAKPGKRVKTAEATQTGLTPEKYHLEQQVDAYTAEYTFNNNNGMVPWLMHSYFEPGEGRSGPFISSDSVGSVGIRFKNRVTDAGLSPQIQFRINGRSRVFHRLRFDFTNDTGRDTIFVAPFGVYDALRSLPEKAIQNESTRLSLIPTQKIEYDWYSVTYVKSVYPQRYLMAGEVLKRFYPTAGKQPLVALHWPDVAETDAVFDITNETEPVRLIPKEKQWQVAPQPRQVIVVAKEVQPVKSLTPITWPVPDLQANYLIITTEKLADAAKAYASYRESAAGGGYKTSILFTQQLYDQFNYGERSPLAIRRYAEYVLQKPAARHLLLIGKGTSFPDELRKTTYPDLVPTLGYPASDVLLTAGLGGQSADTEAIPTGRLSVTTLEEVLTYLEKVKEFERRELADGWQKRLLHLSGGQTDSELVQLRNVLSSIEPLAENSLLGGTVLAKAKPTTTEVIDVDIRREVNEGVGLIAYAGHGSANYLDFNFGLASDFTRGFINKGRYPLMYFNGCGVGNVFYRYNALSTDWMLTPNKGAIAVLANSFWSYITPTQRYLNRFYEKLFKDPATVNKTLGQIRQATHAALANDAAAEEYLRANVHQVILQGDPALKIFPLQAPDYQLDKSSIVLQGDKQSLPIADNSSLRAGIIVRNFGRFEAGQNVQGVVSSDAGDKATFQFTAMPQQDTIYVTVPKNTAVKKYTVELDPAGLVTELNEKNNLAELAISNWAEVGKLKAYPVNILPDKVAPTIEVLLDGRVLRNNEYVSPTPQVTLYLRDNALIAADWATLLDVYLKKCPTCPNEKLTSLKLAERTDYQLQLIDGWSLLPGTYTLTVVARDAAGNQLPRPYMVVFQVTDKDLPAESNLYPMPALEAFTLSYKLVQRNIPQGVAIKLYDTLGRVAYSREVALRIGDNRLSIPVSQLLPGVYTLQLQSADGLLVVKKVVVE